MGRAKLPLVPITRERTKNTTYIKRKGGLFKKLDEFTVLCDVEACAIIYGPQTKRHGNSPVKAETWPPETDKVRRIIQRSAGNIRGKHSHDLSDFLAVRKVKIQREVAKQRAKNWRVNYSGRDIKLLECLTECQLRQFQARLECKLEEALRVKNSRMVEKGMSVSMSRLGGFDDMIKPEMTNNVYHNLNNSYGGGFYSLPDYIDQGLLERAMEKRKEMEGKEEEEEQRALCPVPMIDMKMKTVQYLPYHDHDHDQEDRSRSSMMLWSSNNYQNYASQLGLYDHSYSTTAPLQSGFGDGFQYCSGGGGGSNAGSYTSNNFQYCSGGGGGGGSAGPYTSNSFQYCSGGGDGGSNVGPYTNNSFQYCSGSGGGGGNSAGPYTSNSFQYYTALLGGDGGGGGSDVGSSNGSNLHHYALGGGGDVGSSNGNGFKYYTALLDGGEEGCSNDAMSH